VSCGDDYPNQKNCVDPAVSRVDPNDPNQFGNSGKSSWNNELLGHGSAGGALKNTCVAPRDSPHDPPLCSHFSF
jgi:hypothetical protein